VRAKIFVGKTLAQKGAAFAEDERKETQSNGS
jgi:hypothetical protein